MSLSIRNRLILSISLNGTELPLQINSIDYLHIVESVRLFLPQLTFQFIDVTKFLTRNNLTGDGTLIEILVEVHNVRTLYTFRLFSCVDWFDGSSTKYKITGYWNSPEYWSQTLTKIYKGTCNSVLGTLASECSLTYDGIFTNDSQAWIPMNKTYKEFATDIVDYSYVDDQSCNVMVVTSKGELRLRNLSEFNNYTTISAYYSGVIAQGLDPITDYRLLNRSGFDNNISGYQNLAKEVSLIGSEQNHDRINVIRNSKKLSISVNVKEKITQGRVLFTPVNVGNVHDKYHRAFYQNKRLSDLFSFGLAVVTPMPVIANLLDCVVCVISRPELDIINQYSGRYLLAAKVVYIQGINYYEKMELMRHGTDDNEQFDQV